MRTTLRKDRFEPMEIKERQAFICQTVKIQMNTKVNNKKPGNIQNALKNSHLKESINTAMLRDQQNLYKEPIILKVWIVIQTT